MKSATNPVRDERLRRGWTQRGLARQCTEMGAPLSDSQYSKIERRVCTPRPQVRAVLAELLDLDVTVFDPEERP